MGLFTKDPVPHNNNNNDNSSHSAPRRTSQQSARSHHDEQVEPKHPVVYGEEPRYNPVVGGYSYQKLPSFGQWLKGAGLDILTLAAFGALALGVYFVRPVPTRDFPVNFQDGEVVQPSFAYPLRRHIIPIWAAALIAVLVPMVVVLLMQVRVQSFWDCNNAFFGILYSVVTAAVIQVLLKWLIGGIAPNFLEVCNPILPPQPHGDNVGRGFRQIYYNSAICTGDPFKIARALESFPCGKTTAAFAGLVFLSLYLNAKLKVMSNYHPEMWKLIAMLAPLLGALLIGGTNSIDRGHHWYDCLAGAFIGTLTAFIAYRMVYAAIWDFRFNHIPLNRTIPCPYGSPQTECTKTCFTHQAGWDEAVGTFGGAPCDSKSGNQPQVVSLSKVRGEYAGDSGHGHQVLNGASLFDHRRDVEHGGPRDLSPARPANAISVPAGGARGTPTVTVDEVSPITPHNSNNNRL